MARWGVVLASLLSLPLASGFAVDGVDCLALLHGFEEEAEDGVWQDFDELVLEHEAEHSLEQQCELLLTYFRYEEVTQDLDPEEVNDVDGMAAGTAVPDVEMSCWWADYLSYPVDDIAGWSTLEDGSPCSPEEDGVACIAASARFWQQASRHLVCAPVPYPWRCPCGLRWLSGRWRRLSQVALVGTGQPQRREAGGDQPWARGSARPQPGQKAWWPAARVL